jgi:hypothetical protein
MGAMIRPVRVLLLPAVLLVPVLLTGCGSQKAGAGSGADSPVRAALVEKGHVLKVSGDATKVTRAVLRSAHRPSDAELAAVLPPA